MTTNQQPDAATSVHRPLHWWEQRELEERGCRCRDWSRVRVSDNTDISAIRNVVFAGDVEIGAINRSPDRPDGIENAVIEDCRIGDDVLIRNVGGRLRGCVIEDRVDIENVGRIEFEPEAECGMLTSVSVLDETGSRPVHIFPGLSSQIAHLSTHNPRWAEETLLPMLEEKFRDTSPRHVIGHDSVVRDCGALINVSIGPEIVVEGAERLVDGMIINNAASGRGLSGVGAGVNAEHFIIEDGYVGAGSMLRNCYVGQGVEVDKGFSAHDTLMFANTSLENGEACAVLAGPYTVSMHKSSLLIGCQLSFMNAGSATNQSNHMYKLGPVHWGVMERGVKTASCSYLMWGAKIGAFSLVMGTHKNHPDATDFPFSYLFGDEKGATTVVPGMMLRSCGLQRDEKKWPTRDRRLKRKLPLHDRINFEVLNPMTVERMIKSLDLIDTLLSRPGDDDLFIRHKGMKFRAAGLERAKNYYKLAIATYLVRLLDGRKFPAPKTTPPSGWVDLAGQVVTRETVDAILQAETLEEIDALLESAALTYEDDQMEWIASVIPQKLIDRRALWEEYARELAELVDDDRASYLQALSDEQQMLAD